VRGRHLIRCAAALGVIATGCGADSGGPATQPTGVYQRSTSTSATWTLVLDHRRFAFTRDGATACTWAYGGLTVRGRRMAWEIVDAGGRSRSPADAPGDRYDFAWSQYRDLLALDPVRNAQAGDFADRRWRQIATAPSERYLSRRCPPPRGALEPTGVENVRPRRGVTLDFRGDLTRTPAGTWVGRAVSKQLGPGRMTISGIVVFGRFTRNRVTFTFRSARGVLRGCAINSILRRPHARYVWDGQGQITWTSPQLRRYLATAGGIGGVTSIHHLRQVHGGFGTFPGRRGPTGGPRVVC
jgi:hypothetical protein